MLPTADAADNIYLSPHYDDAAYSLGAWIAGHPGGTIVNLFTRSGFVAGAKGGVRPEPAVVDEISALRQAEDRRFTARYGLAVIELGLEEPSLRGRGSRDVAGIGDDIEQVREPLTGTLDRLVADGRTKQIFVPAAIGGHVNHVATRAVAVEWATGAGRLGELRFYEDLPYAARGHLRRRGLDDLRAALPGERLERIYWPSGAEKLEAVNLYPSQQPTLQKSLRRFTPRTWWPLRSHEAIWRVGPAS
jgi:LmbE family N-acetylglucosaminyl deacetylase